MTEKIDNVNNLTGQDMSRVIEMAWEDRTPFEAIEINYGLTEDQVVKLMRANLKQKTFKVWRIRVSGRKTKHLQLRGQSVLRHYCKTQYKVRTGW